MGDFRAWWNSPAGFMFLGVSLLLIGLIRWVGEYGTYPWLQVAAGVVMVGWSIQEFRREERDDAED